jgi:hypothetical protein
MVNASPDLTEMGWRVIFEIPGTNVPAHLGLEGPFSDGHDRYYLVSLLYRNLSGSWPIGGLDPARFLGFFEDLADHRNGWEGEKRVASLDDQFSIRCEYQGNRCRPEVWMYVRLATDFADPYWTVELRLELAPESLEALAARARSFFTRSAEPGTDPDPKRGKQVSSS